MNEKTTNKIDNIMNKDFLSHVLSQPNLQNTAYRTLEWYENWLFWHKMRNDEKKIFKSLLEPEIAYESAIYISQTTGVSKTANTILLIAKVVKNLYDHFYALGYRKEDLKNKIHNYSPIYYTHGEIVQLARDLSSNSGDERTNAKILLRDIMEARCLIIDDFSTAKMGGVIDGKLELLYSSIIDTRDNNRESTVTIITTNEDIDTMNNNFPDKIISRMLGMVNQNLLGPTSKVDKRTQDNRNDLIKK